MGFNAKTRKNPSPITIRLKAFITLPSLFQRRNPAPYLKPLGKKKTALEEAYEEAGVLGEISDDRKATIEHPDWTLDLYPMKISKLLKKWPEMDWREREWVPLKKIEKWLAYPALVECVEELAG